MIADRRRCGIAVDQQWKIQIVAPEMNCSNFLLGPSSYLTWVKLYRQRRLYGYSRPAPLSVTLPGAMRLDPSRVWSRKSIFGGGECRALSSQLCSAEKPPAHLGSGSFRGSLLKSISTRERRYSQRVSLQMPFMAFLRVLYAFTNYCRTDGVRFWHLRYLAISSGCRWLTGITFRPTQLAKWPCAVFHATILQNSFDPAPASCGY